MYAHYIFAQFRTVLILSPVLTTYIFALLLQDIRILLKAVFKQPIKHASVLQHVTELVFCVPFNDKNTI